MTSSMPEARMFLNELSPITQRRASTRFDLPQPFGPTTPVKPASILNSAASQKLLKPVRRKRSNFIVATLRPGGPCANSPAFAPSSPFPFANHHREARTGFSRHIGFAQSTPIREKPVRNWGHRGVGARSSSNFCRLSLAFQPGAIDEDGPGRMDLERLGGGVSRLVHSIVERLIFQAGREIGLGHAAFHDLALKLVQRIGGGGPVRLMIEQNSTQDGPRHNRKWQPCV